MYSRKYTLGEFRDIILKLLQRYSSNGSVYPSGEKQDIENRLVTSLNIHLARLWHEFSGNIKRQIVEKSDSAYEMSFGNGNCTVHIPEDCSEILAVYDQNGRKIRRSAYEILEDERIIVIFKTDNDEYILEYVPYPPTFPESGDDDAQICISPLFADALSYMCAADLCPVYETELYSKLTYKYREMLENLYTRRRQNSIVNKFYGIVRKRSLLPKVNGG